MVSLMKWGAYLCAWWGGMSRRMGRDRIPGDRTRLMPRTHYTHSHKHTHARSEVLAEKSFDSVHWISGCLQFSDCIISGSEWFFKTEEYSQVKN